jgi:hypothetical protein
MNGEAIAIVTFDDTKADVKALIKATTTDYQ